jgi:uncharacterized membrane protein YsdA (DUF1294 family)
VSQTGAIWLVITLALLAANLPFLNQRLLAMLPLDKPKSLGLRLAELLLYYFVVGGIGLWLEQRAGQIAPQKWEFYAITATLFLTLAFPGFVYRYLLRHRD